MSLNLDWLDEMMSLMVWTYGNGVVSAAKQQAGKAVARL